MMKQFLNAEVLCPAGDFERLQAAVQFGADAVYLSGKQFGMRSAPRNFELDELKNAIDFAHQHQKKVYVTCNTLFSNQDIDCFVQYVRLLREFQADAVIVSDLGALKVAEKNAPTLPRHISVQTGIYNYAAAQMMYDLGASRVILSRELSVDQIAEIRDKTSPELELEAFVHGAMCVSFSGRCLLSDYMTGRSASFGDCAQPCRWKYHLVEEKRPGEYFPIFEDDEGSHILNAKDLCLISYIPQLLKAGVSSLKIEGRAKSVYYTAVTANAYRCALDDYLHNPTDWRPAPWILEELDKISHRPYTTGFFRGREFATQEYQNGGYIREYQLVGIAESQTDGWLVFSGRNKVSKGDVLDILSPCGQPFLLPIETIFDLDGNEIETANCPRKLFRVPCSQTVAPGSLLRKESL